jgi:hypothetical protein
MAVRRVAGRGAGGRGGRRRLRRARPAPERGRAARRLFGYARQCISAGSGRMAKQPDGKAIGC